MDELHDVPGKSWKMAREDFAANGCAVFNTSHGIVNPDLAQVSAILFDLLGDDVDGIAAEMADFEAFN